MKFNVNSAQTPCVNCNCTEYESTETLAPAQVFAGGLAEARRKWVSSKDFPGPGWVREGTCLANLVSDKPAHEAKLALRLWRRLPLELRCHGLVPDRLRVASSYNKKVARLCALLAHILAPSSLALYVCALLLPFHTQIRLSFLVDRDEARLATESILQTFAFFQHSFWCSFCVTLSSSLRTPLPCVFGVSSAPGRCSPLVSISRYNACTLHVVSSTLGPYPLSDTSMIAEICRSS